MESCDFILHSELEDWNFDGPILWYNFSVHQLDVTGVLTASVFTYGSPLERDAERFREPGSFFVYLVFLISIILVCPGFVPICFQLVHCLDIGFVSFHLLANLELLLAQPCYS
jgi:hypothetical protein